MTPSSDAPCATRSFLRSAGRGVRQSFISAVTTLARPLQSDGAKENIIAALQDNYIFACVLLERGPAPSDQHDCDLSLCFVQVAAHRRVGTDDDLDAEGARV